MGEVGEVQRFRNDTDGIVGAVAINEEGKREGIAVQPGDTVELSEVEQQLTARAPRDPKDNPLVGGGPNGGPALVPVEAGDDRPLRPEPAPEPPAEDPEPAEEPAPEQEPPAAATGSRAPEEEVGTPDASEPASEEPAAA